MPNRPQVHRPAHRPPPEQARRQYDTWRGSSSARGYDRDWQKVRAAVLADEPLCRACMAQGRVTEATEVHHTRPLREHPNSRLDRATLMPLCKPCHSGITVREQRQQP